MLSSKEVNPLDLIVLDALKLYEPDVYRRIPQFFKNIVRIKKEFALSDDNRIKDLALELDRLLELASDNNRKNVRKTLLNLFPQLSGIDGSHADENEHDLLKTNRVGHEKEFLKYFACAIVEGEISQREFIQIISSTNNRSRFREHLEDITSRGLLENFIERLISFEDTISLDNAKYFVTVLFELGESLPDEKILPLTTIQWDIQIIGIITRYLLREGDSDKLNDIITRSIKDSRGIYLPLRFINMQIHLNEEEKDSKHKLMNIKDMPTYKKICIKKIEEYAKQEKLDNNPKLGYILFIWFEWGNQGHVKSWVNNFVNKEKGFIRLVSSLLHRAYSWGTTVSRYITVQLEEMLKYMSLEEIERRMSDEDPTNLTDIQKTALKALGLAIEDMREGKPTDFGAGGISEEIY